METSSRDEQIAIGGERLRFDCPAGQIMHSVANASPPLRRFFTAVSPKLRRWALPLVTRFSIIPQV